MFSTVDLIYLMWIRYSLCEMKCLSYFFLFTLFRAGRDYNFYCWTGYEITGVHSYSHVCWETLEMRTLSRDYADKMKIWILTLHNLDSVVFGSGVLLIWTFSTFFPVIRFPKYVCTTWATLSESACKSDQSSWTPWFGCLVQLGWFFLPFRTIVCAHHL